MESPTKSWLELLQRNKLGALYRDSLARSFRAHQEETAPSRPERLRDRPPRRVPRADDYGGGQNGL